MISNQNLKFKVSTGTLKTKVQWNNAIKILKVHFFHNTVLLLAKCKVDYRHFLTCKDSKIFTFYSLSQETTRIYNYHIMRVKREKLDMGFNPREKGSKFLELWQWEIPE